MKKRRIKVLMVGPDRSVHGGISAIVNSYYEAGLDRKVNLKYIGTMKEGSKLKKLMVAMGAYAEFLGSVRKCDLVHINASSDSSIMRKSFFVRAAKRRGKTVILHQHGGDFKNYYENQISKSFRKYIKDTLDMADAMLVLTDSWKEYFGKLTDPGKIEVLPNAIVTRGEVEKNYSGSHDLHKLLFLGRICKDKGMDELLEAVDEIHEEEPDVKLYLGGIFEDGRYIAEVEERSTYVKHIGWVSGEDKNKYLSECGIFVLPTYYEGFPVSIIEAMYSGMVAIASDVGGIPDIIKDGVNGLLVPSKDAGALKKCILGVMKDKALAERLKVSAHDKALNCYSMDVCMKKLVNIYNSLV